MNKEEIYQLMDIEKGEDFKYFESLADLLETDDNYDADTLFEVLNDIDTDTLSEHASSYFEQMQENIPDDEAELYTLIENIKKEISGLTETCSSEVESEDKERALMDLASEIVRFHEWYIDSCLVNAVEEETGEEQSISIRDALFRLRAEKFMDEAYRYDFEDALDYELSEYIMQFSDLMGMVN